MVKQELIPGGVSFRKISYNVVSQALFKYFLHKCFIDVLVRLGMIAQISLECGSLLCNRVSPRKPNYSFCEANILIMSDECESIIVQFV